ncbi:MAG: hypothetical protein C4523_12125 [Myxococcales bacterium]|nr:MAG: hypothetical protein C4523_12125 [Myxococcales bacterium]
MAGQKRKPVLKKIRLSAFALWIAASVAALPLTGCGDGAEDIAEVEAAAIAGEATGNGRADLAPLPFAPSDLREQIGDARVEPPFETFVALVAEAARTGLLPAEYAEVENLADFFSEEVPKLLQADKAANEELSGEAATLPPGSEEETEPLAATLAAPDILLIGDSFLDPFFSKFSSYLGQLLPGRVIHVNAQFGRPAFCALNNRVLPWCIIQPISQFLNPSTGNPQARFAYVNLGGNDMAVACNHLNCNNRATQILIALWDSYNLAKIGRFIKQAGPQPILFQKPGLPLEARCETPIALRDAWQAMWNDIYNILGFLSVVRPSYCPYLFADLRHTLDMPGSITSSCCCFRDMGHLTQVGGFAPLDIAYNIGNVDCYPPGPIYTNVAMGNHIESMNICAHYNALIGGSYPCNLWSAPAFKPCYELPEP